MGQVTMNMCLLLHHITRVYSQSFTSSLTSITSPHLNKLPKWPKLEVQELLAANGSKWCAVAEHPLSDDEDDDNDDDGDGDDVGGGDEDEVHDLPALLVKPITVPLRVHTSQLFHHTVVLSGQCHHGCDYN